MSVLKVLEVELLVSLGAAALSYGAISLVLWHLGRDSARRMRERDRRGDFAGRTNGQP